jgi:hypothetical protein
MIFGVFTTAPVEGITCEIVAVGADVEEKVGEGEGLQI